MSVLRRNQLDYIDKLLGMFPAVLILGVRQCGKSTLAKMSRNHWKYYDLENSKDYDYITSDINFFFQENNQHIIIDEAQELPALFKNFRGVIDQAPQKTNRFILTGSSSPELISMASDSLAGRIGIVELGTLKMNELDQNEVPHFYKIFNEAHKSTIVDTLKNIPKPTHIDPIDHFLKGGYPAPRLANAADYHEEWMENYFQTYINRDIKKLFPKLDHIKYRRFIQMLSELSGTIINKAQLGRSIDVSEVTIRDYLDIADKTFIWRIIPSFEKTNIKSITKMPKGIFRDSGLLNYIQNISTRDELLRSPRFGQAFESFVIEELIKGINSQGIKRWSYHYFRTKNGVEVDLILDGKFGTLPIEIKSGTNTSIKDLKSLKYFIEKNNLSLGIVINNDSEIKMISGKIIQVPASYI